MSNIYAKILSFFVRNKLLRFTRSSVEYDIKRILKKKNCHNKSSYLYYDSNCRRRRDNVISNEHVMYDLKRINGLSLFFQQYNNNNNNDTKVVYIF